MNNYSYKLAGQKPAKLLNPKINSPKPGNQMRFQGKTATAIILYPKNRIVLIKRKTPPFIGYWALPGGRAEPRENQEQTVIREVKEETGLDVQIVRKIGDYHEKGVQGGYEYDYLPACFLTKRVGGDLRRQETEIAEIKLFELDKLPDILAFEHMSMILDYVAQETMNPTDFS
jgi:8-oxo-dGTP diphosphatase